MALWLDYSAGYPGGDAIRAWRSPSGDSVVGVIRYIGTSGRRKNLTRAEADDLRAHGLQLFGVFEDAEADFAGGRPAGRRNAAAARADAQSCGVPDLRIFAAIDQHVYGDDVGLALDYVAGFADVLGREHTGCYGFAEVMNGAHAALLWQAGAATDIRSDVQLWQDNTFQPSIGGVTCDVNHQLLPLPEVDTVTPEDIRAAVRAELWDFLVQARGERSHYRDKNDPNEPSLSWQDTLWDGNGQAYRNRDLINGSRDAVLAAIDAVHQDVRALRDQLGNLSLPGVGSYAVTGSLTLGAASTPPAT